MKSYINIYYVYVCWLLYVLPSITQCLSCNKVATLPNEFDVLLPQHNALKRVHVSNYFFIQSNNNNDIHIRIPIYTKSVVKLQVTPYHTQLAVRVACPTRTTTLTASSGIPVDFTLLNHNDLFVGDLYVTFTEHMQEQDTMNQELRSLMISDTICTQPYMLFEIYYEHYEHYMNRMNDINSYINDLNSFSYEFWNVFNELSNAEMKTKRISSNVDNDDDNNIFVQKIKRALTPYKLKLKKSLSSYKQYNLTVLEEFDINIPHDINVNQHKLTTKYFIKFQLYSDFLLGGSIYIIIINTKHISSLNDFDCIYDGKCILSQRHNVNGMILETVLTPGEYKLLLVNMNIDINEFNTYIKANYLPISAGIKLKHIRSSENKFNCKGKRIPTTFDHLLSVNSHYFEYKGNIAFDMVDLLDEVYFITPMNDDYIIRVNTFFASGSNINIYLYQIDETTLYNDVHSSYPNVNHVNNTYVLEQIRNERTVKVLSTWSTNFGGQSALYAPLYRNKIYYLVFDYHDSLFTAFNRKRCEMYYLKLAITSTARLKQTLMLNSNAESQCVFDVQVFNTFIDKFDIEHYDMKYYINNEYSVASPIMRSYNDLYGNKEIRVIYARNIHIRHEVSVYISVESDYVTANVIPLIMPNSDLTSDDKINVDALTQQLLRKDMRRYLLHRNRFNIKLSPGTYTLLLIHGLTQYSKEYGNKSVLSPLYNQAFLPKCAVFKVKMNVLMLSSPKMMLWECNYKRYHHIPSDIDMNDSNSNSKDRYYYFNHNMLIPIERNVIKVKTAVNEVYYLRVKVQYSSIEDVNVMDVVLKKEQKVLGRCKRVVSKEGEKSSIVYMNYLLSEGSEYEIQFMNVYKELNVFYNKCNLFTLDLLIVNVNAMKTQHNAIKCNVNIPQRKHIIYERLIDLDGSFMEYKSKTVDQLLDTKYKSNNNNIRDNDIELHPNQRLFRFAFSKDTSSSSSTTMEYVYPFEVSTTHMARVTLLIETPYAIEVDIQAKIHMISTSSNDNEVSEYITQADIEDENILSIRGVLLSQGSYKLTISIDKDMYSSKIQSILNNICVEFTAMLIIENKDYDYFNKGANTNLENCPYNEFPSNMNIPGWVSPDTSHSINAYQRFKVKNQKMIKTFTLPSRSLFKFYLPDEDSINFHNSITLSLDKGNRKSELIHTMNGNDNYVALMLEEGTYMIEFTFELSERRAFMKEEYTHVCYYFDVYVLVQPLNEFVDVAALQNGKCVSDITAVDAVTRGDTFMYRQLVYKPQIQSNYAEIVRSIRIPPNDMYKRKMQIELIINNYIAPLYTFDVYKVDPNTKDLIEVDHKLISYGNFIWVVVNMDKSIEYQINFISGVYENISLCNEMFISYININDQPSTTITSVITKASCDVNNKLPRYFFDNNTNNNNNGVLKAYGGGQNRSNGEMYFYGVFLLPKRGNSIRSEFVVKEESIAFIQVVPKYKVNINDIVIELYYGREKIQTTMYTAYNGLIIAFLPRMDYYMTNENELNCYLDITFDRHRSSCEAFALLFSLIPENAYRDVYMNCATINDESDVEQLPSSLTISNTNVYQYASHVHKGFVKNANNNYEKRILLTLTTSMAVDVVLKYIHSDNLMDVMLCYENGSRVFKTSVDTVDSGHVNGIWIHKNINVKLKPGKYVLKLLYHSVFSNNLNQVMRDITDHRGAKVKANYIDNICFAFNLDIASTLLHVHSTVYDDNDKEISSSIISNKDSGVTVLTVYPVGASKLRLGNALHVKVTFPYDSITSSKQIQLYSNLIYLLLHSHDNNIQEHEHEHIYPDYISEYASDYILYTFNLNERTFKLASCYKLHFNTEHSNTVNDTFISYTDITYCTMQCKCNPKSNYICSLKGKCQCKAPYTGTHCNTCIDGYSLSNANECISNKLLNMRCDDKTTCNGNGYCIIPESKFDPYDKNIKNPCKCNPGFDSLKGYPTSSFCNKCTNSKKYYPFCYESGNAQDKLKFSFTTHCSDFADAPVLPFKLYSKTKSHNNNNNNALQASDGSINYNAVLKVYEPEEEVEIIIREDSLVRVMYISKEMNRAKVMMLANKNSEKAIAQTEGKDKNESFIVRLLPRKQSYVIRIVHLNLKPMCNRYQLKIAIEPVVQVHSALMHCEQASSHLPQDELFIYGNDNYNTITDKWFSIPDTLVLSSENFALKQQDNTLMESNYSFEHKQFAMKGVLSHQHVNEPFVYNIKLNVYNAVTFSAVVKYSYISSEIILSLRNENGTFIKNSYWLVSEVDDGNGKEMHSGLVDVLDKGVYYLTIIGHVQINHLVQMFYSSNGKGSGNGFNLQQHCFKFMLNLQSHLIEKPSSLNNVTSVEYSRMFNAIVNVEPSSQMNTNVNKKLHIYISFTYPIHPKLKRTNNTNELKHASSSSSFQGVFYLQRTHSMLSVNNNNNNDILYPNHVYLSGDDNKRFHLIYNTHTLDNDVCYTLKYDLTALQSYYDETLTIISDEPLIHKYCTKRCDCNAVVDFDCSVDNKCICPSPYTGDTCMRCIEGYFFTNEHTCISQSNCDANVCNNKGKCVTSSSDSQLPLCQCNTHFKGSDCSVCDSNDKVFPNCDDMLSASTNVDVDVDNKRLFTNDININEGNTISRSDNNCEHQFIPNDINNLGYLHLDGNMHVSGKYSLKTNGKMYMTMVFTLKEDSHVKIYIEHTKMNYVLSMFVLREDKSVIARSGKNVGPVGEGTATLLDVVAPGGNEYVVVFYVKELGSVDDEYEYDVNYEEEVLSAFYTDNDVNGDDECLNVFMEMQIMTLKRENNVIKELYDVNALCNDTTTITNDARNKAMIIPRNMTIYHSESYTQLKQGITQTHVHIRNINDVNNINYFHYEYLYIPDLHDKQIVFELDVSSKFLTAQIGILIEILDMPESFKAKSHKLTNTKINELLNSSNITEPLCNVHCFSGIKKYNSIIISRILPSDTLIRIWLYDISPRPFIINNAIHYTPNTCVQYQSTFSLFTINSTSPTLNNDVSSLCHYNELPVTLNTKEYLGNGAYTKRFGFHVLDSFRVDRSHTNNSIHITSFTITKSHMFRLVVFPNRIDTDIELYLLTSSSTSTTKSNEKRLISKSNSKQFEDVIAIEIPPGNYEIAFRFYAPPSGYHKCETITIELAMQELTYLNTNIQRMLHKYNNNNGNAAVSKEYPSINIFDHFVSGSDLYGKDLRSITYRFPMELPFVINEDNTNMFKPIITIADITFNIDIKDDKKLRLNAFVDSDFLYVDVGLYLQYTPLNGGITTVIAGTRRKNVNTLYTKKLQSGKYVLSIQYYRKLHYKDPVNTFIEDIRLLQAVFAEMQFDVQIINISDDYVRLTTSYGDVDVLPAATRKITHAHLCRKFGMPVPKTLYSLRYLEFTAEMHVMDTYLLPPMAQGEDVITFKLYMFSTAVIRVYVECSEAAIDVVLRKKTYGNRYQVVATSQHGVHFGNIIAIIDDVSEYEIVLMYKGFIEKRSGNAACKTFKMDIAIEKKYNDECPTIGVNKVLTDIKAIPTVLPLTTTTKDKAKLYIYDTKKDKDVNGYVYMLRHINDTYVEYAMFDVLKPIDFKFEISNEHIETPITAMLVNTNADNDSNSQQSSLITKTFKLINPTTKSSVIAYSELFEQRTSLLVKNLPQGRYMLYLYIPGLSIPFTQDKTCALYDMHIEIKKSRNHFKAKELVYTSSTNDAYLDLPVRLPKTLNTPKFMNGFGTYTYVNYINNYYMRYNQTTETYTGIHVYAISNTITFTLQTECLVVFEVEQHNSNMQIQLALLNSISARTNTKTINTVLPSGTYELMITLSQTQIEGEYKSKETFAIEAMSKLIQFKVGITPTSRVRDVYLYNNVHSTTRQCENDILPIFSDIEDKGEYRYHTFIFTVHKSRINNGIITSQVISLMNSTQNRFIAEIGTEMLFARLNMYILTQQGNTKYMMKFNNNHGYIDLMLPKGKYTIQLVLEEQMLLSEYDCILMSLNIHVIELDKVKRSNSVLTTQLVAFNTVNKMNVIKTSSCNGGVIPLEIWPNSDIPEQRISPQGDYALHLDNALYFIRKQKTKYKNNMNEININVNHESFVHITTKATSTKLFTVVPQIKYNTTNNSNNVYKKPRITLLSHNMRERNTFFHLQRSASNKDYYTLQLSLDKDIAHESELPQCPLYELDIQIMDITLLARKFNCPKTNGKIYKAVKPQMKVLLNKTSSTYHEKVLSSYFTEREYGEYMSNHSSSVGLYYVITVEIEERANTEYYINANVGYYHSVSVFDMFLFKENNNDILAYASTSVDNEGTFPFRKLLQSTVNAGVYSIVIVEYTWHNVTNVMKATAQGINKEDIYLCLPFSYSLDIVAVSEDTSVPMVINVLPVGPIVFKGKDEDIVITITLNKVPFTYQNEPITNMYNYIDIINTFHLRKRKQGVSTPLTENDSNVYYIHPDKVQGSYNNKEWELLFLRNHFEEGYNYEFGMTDGYLYDHNYEEFINNVTKLVIKVEYSRNSLIEGNNEGKGVSQSMQSAIAISGKDIESVRHVGMNYKGEEKCNYHGVYSYDNILGKYLCTCFNGFTGKYCDICQGKVIENKCVEVEDEDGYVIEGKEKYNEAPSITMNEYKKELNEHEQVSQTYVVNNDDNDCRKCVNGICDGKTGKCICDRNYKGRYCNERKVKFEHDIDAYTKLHPSRNDSNSNNNYYSIITYICVFIILVLIIRYVLRWVIHVVFMKRKEYKTLNQNEGEVTTINPTEINTKEKQFNIDDESQHLVH